MQGAGIGLRGKNWVYHMVSCAGLSKADVLYAPKVGLAHVLYVAAV